MGGFNFQHTDIPGLLLIEPFLAEDERGYFLKDYSAETFAGQGIEHDLQEVFYTSSHRGVIRAIHFQRERQQAKLVRVVSGEVFDVVVDLRRDSPGFGRWQGFRLDGPKKQLLIPGCCGHGYLVLQPSIVSYKCNEKFYGEYDDGIIWDDRELAIEWPLDEAGELIISQKDRELQSFAEFKSKYGGLYGGDERISYGKVHPVNSSFYQH